ncbi:MAG: sigma-70 family RNA polymerase sigma factor [Planctomycetes bacterium]|nr:sigma-70 family RNA polymerase sigma factor [Planctomycetota bacterium]
MSEVTRILSAIDRGDPRAAEQLLPLVYDELRRLAAHRIARESPGQTLQATALVHEAYLRLVDQDQTQSWNSRGHFFGAAAEAMRRILVERARRKRSIKAGGEVQRRNLDEFEPELAQPDIELLALDEALTKLESQDKRRAELVKLRFFAGMTVEQAAEALGISKSTADNDWAYARCWLRLEIDGAGDQSARR